MRISRRARWFDSGDRGSPDGAKGEGSDDGNDGVPGCSGDSSLIWDGF